MFDKTNPFQTGSKLLRWLWTVCVTLRKPFSRCKAWQGAVKCDWWHLWRRTITAQYILCSHVNVSLLIFMKLVRRIWASLNVEVSNKIRKGKQMQKVILSDRMRPLNNYTRVRGRTAIHRMNCICRVPLYISMARYFISQGKKSDSPLLSALTSDQSIYTVSRYFIFNKLSFPQLISVVC